jgi:hypothetical protein
MRKSPLGMSVKVAARSDVLGHHRIIHDSASAVVVGDNRGILVVADSARAATVLNIPTTDVNERPTNAIDANKARPAIPHPATLGDNAV